MSILKILQGKEKKIWKLEDRINKVHQEINSSKYLSLDELNSLSNSIAHLKYNMNKGSLKKAINDENRNINYLEVNSLISKIDNYRNEKYDVNINDNKYVNEINEIYNNKKLGENKFYYLNDRFNEIEKRIDKIDTNNCSLKDIDSLNYILLSMEKDSYMKQKAKKDNQFYETKTKLEKKIKNVINKAQKNLNQYTISYHLDDEEIDEAKDNKIILQQSENVNEETENYESLDKQIKKYDSFMASKLKGFLNIGKAFMIGLLGLTAYELGSNYFNNNETNNEINEEVVEEVIEANNENIEYKDTLKLDDFSNKTEKKDKEKNQDFVKEMKEYIINELN